jgi:hypothetical protein
VRFDGAGAEVEAAPAGGRGCGAVVGMEVLAWAGSAEALPGLGPLASADVEAN